MTTGLNGSTISTNTYVFGGAANEIIFTNASGQITQSGNLTYNNSTHVLTVNGGNLTVQYGIFINGSLGLGSGAQDVLVVEPTVAQTGTASYNLVYINPTISTTGSGPSYAINYTVSSSILFGITAAGVPQFSQTTAPGTTSVLISNSPGSNSTPTGYITVNINGTTAYVPYFT